MAVLLSPVGGVAGQFFDNNGNPLSGGKMYSYVAGTTTPQATYTSGSGVTAHSNPIILDSGGRVPGGEIWLTDGLQYKFVLKTSTDVLIGTYDNIVGINSNFVNFLTETEVQTATASQTVFTLTTMQYQPGTNNLSVFVDGVNQIDGATYSYVETSSTVVTFTSGLHVGALVKFTTAQTLSTGVTDASLVTYTPAGTGAVATTVQTKLRESVSVLDFGADPSATASANYTAFATATTYAAANGLGILIPAGSYTLDTNWVISTAGMRVYADGKVILNFTNAGNCVSIDGGASSSYIFDVHFGTSDNPIWINGNASTTTALYWRAAHHGSASVKVWNCVIGHRTQFAVCNNFWITVSNSERVSSVLTPTTGISCERRSAGEDTADNTWFTPIVEGILTSTGHGIYLGNTNRNKFIGGTVEGDVVGVFASGGAVGDNINGLYTEVNTSIDFDISGTLITLTDCFTGTGSPTPSSFYAVFRTGATDCRVIGGDIAGITVQSGAVRTQIIGIAHDVGVIVTDAGTNTTIVQGQVAWKQPYGSYLGGGSVPLKFYDEGIITATITCGTSGTVTLNSSFNTLGWVKVGRLVTVTGLLIVSGVSSPVGTCVIGNLPYSTDSNSSSRASVSVRAAFLASGAATAVQGRIISSDNKIYLEYYTAGTATNLSPQVQTNSEFYISATYLAVN